MKGWHGAIFPFIEQSAIRPRLIKHAGKRVRGDRCPMIFMLDIAPASRRSVMDPIRGRDIITTSVDNLGKFG